jgi:hypothetical protein
MQRGSSTDPTLLLLEHCGAVLCGALRCVALLYYCAVCDNVNVWAIARQDQAKLLSNAIPTAECLTRENVVLMLVVDLSRPQESLKEAEAWATTARAHIDSLLDKSPGLREQLATSARQRWLGYGKAKATTTSHHAGGGDEHAASGLSDGVTGVAEGGGGDGSIIAEEEEDLSAMMESGVLLGEGVMTGSLGAPTVVVGVNSDTYVGEEQASGENEKVQDFVQFQVRGLAMRLGAGAIYVSSKSGTNMDVLNDYLTHTLHPTEFALVHKPQVSSDDGW